MSPRSIALYSPRLSRVRRSDPPLTDIIEGRRSIRTYDRRPITIRQLGEFLFRSARIKTLMAPDGELLLYQSSKRPYPGAGGCYELEIYVAANRCVGLRRGVYHYMPLVHRLEPIAGSAKYIRQLMLDTFIDEAVAGQRQIVLIIAARFQRMSWKYNGSTYAAILKNVGVLFQTFYLVATAMRLAPCALGGGNAELFSEMVNTPFHEETSVGEFMLGSAPQDA